MRLRSFLACAALLLASPLAGRPTWAAPADPDVALTRAQAANFQQALSALSAQGHAALVAEGAPLKPRLTGKDIPALTAPQPLTKAVSALAAAYDYDAKRDDAGVFVLTKRYTDPRDIPGVTMPECVQAAKNILAVLDTFNPHFQQSVYVDGPNDQRDTMINFVASLSPGQYQALNGKALHYRDLSPDQQGLIQRLFLYQYVQMPAGPVEAAVSNIETQSHSVLTGRDEAGHSGLCIEMPVPPDAVVKTSKDGKHYLLTLDTGNTMPSQSQQAVLLPPPAPGTAAAPGATTLAAVLAGLKPISGAQPAVDVPLRDKPVTAAGLAGVAPMDALQALAEVYGLRIGATLQGAPELESLPPPVPASLREISADVWASLPAPLARALHFADGADAPPPMPTGGDAAALRKWQQADQQRWDTRWSLAARPVDLGRAAAARVWEAIQPQLKAAGPDARVPVSSLDALARGALAVVLVSSMVNTLYDYYGGRPNQLALDGFDNFGQMVVYSDPKETATVRGKLVPSIHMETIDPYTHERIGMGGTVYHNIP